MSHHPCFDTNVVFQTRTTHSYKSRQSVLILNVVCQKNAPCPKTLKIPPNFFFSKLNFTAFMLNPQGIFRSNIICLPPILIEQQAGNQNLTLELNPKFDVVCKAASLSRLRNFFTTRQK